MISSPRTFYFEELKKILDSKNGSCSWWHESNGPISFKLIWLVCFKLMWSCKYATILIQKVCQINLTAIHVTYFFYVSSEAKLPQMWNEKRASPFTFLRWRLWFNLPLYPCRKKEHFSLFLNINTGSGRCKNAYKIDFSWL